MTTWGNRTKRPSDKYYLAGAGAFAVSSGAWLLNAPGMASLETLGAAAVASGAIAALPWIRQRNTPRDSLTGLAERDGVTAALEAAVARTVRQKGKPVGALVLEIDNFKLIEEGHDREAVETILKTVAGRLCASLRPDDLPARLDGATFAVALDHSRRLDLEAAIQLSSRIQQQLSEPIPLDGTNIYVTVSAGFSLSSRIADPTGAALLQTATSALIEAQRFGPGALRSYSAAMHNRIVSRNLLSDHVKQAMDNGEIRAFFQPQVSTQTGRLTGFETLARWHHPERGLIPPVEFLPALVQSGMMDRLGEIMVRDALGALARWDNADFDIPRVGVNFSDIELSDPSLVDRISWDLDNYDLDPNRLSIEVLETLVASRADDVVIRNLTGLAELGCSLDLDDFGTGHASITSIRRYAIERIKIDRSFVTNIDKDAEQQKMVTAILTMADRLGLDTLAEGVETASERNMLTELGCGHIQGFGISRPLPPEDVDRWISDYQSRKGEVIRLDRASGA